MRLDFLLALVLAGSGLPFGAAMMSAPILFPGASKRTHQVIFIGGIALAVALWILAGGIAMQVQVQNTRRTWAIIGMAIFGIAFLTCLGVFLRTKPQEQVAKIEETKNTATGGVTPKTEADRGQAGTAIQTPSIPASGSTIETRLVIKPGAEPKTVLHIQTGGGPVPDRVTPYASLTGAQLAEKLATVGKGLRSFEKSHAAAAKKISESATVVPDDDADRAQRAEIRAQLAKLDADDTMRWRTLYLFDARDLVDEASKRLRVPRPADQSPNPLSRDGAQAFGSGQLYGAGLSNLAEYLDALAADLRN